MVNSVVLVGTVVYDPDILVTGSAILVLRIGNSNETGAAPADITIEIDDPKVVDLVRKYVQRGKLLGIQGRLLIGPDVVTVRALNIRLLTSKAA